MASVQELILAAQAQQKPNPVASALENFLGAVNQGIVNRPDALLKAAQLRALEEETARRRRLDDIEDRTIRKFEKDGIKVTGATKGSQENSVSDDFGNSLNQLIKNQGDKKQFEKSMASMLVKAKTDDERKLVKDISSVISFDSKNEGLRDLSATDVRIIDEGASVSQMLPDVEKALDNNKDIFGPIEGRIRSNNPYDTRSQTVDAQMRTASQSFGRFMEGGVLRKEDEEKYRKMFPQLSDTHDVAKNKLAIVNRMLSTKFNSLKSSLSKSGFDTTGIPEVNNVESVFDNKTNNTPSVKIINVRPK